MIKHGHTATSAIVKLYVKFYSETEISMDIISTFKTVRDMPYRIPLTLEEKDFCCNGKHKTLKILLKKQGFETRYRICTFLWSSIHLPEKVSSIPHDDDCRHVYLEVLINSVWVIVDATWDIGLKNIFYVNEWNGKSNTEIAVKPIEIFTSQKSTDVMNNENDKEILNDLETNGKFYKAFNDWLKENRTVPVSE